MSKVRARMYCHGLGDCALLEIAQPTGGAFWMLIDCGIHGSAKGGTARIAEVVADIRSQTGRLDVVVMTHEHWDHISGFTTADFGQFEVGEVWCAWTENPADEVARDLDKFKGDALTALVAANDRLQAQAATGPAAAALAEGVDGLLGFFGIAGERSRAARDAVVALGKGNVQYLKPGTVAPLPKGLGVTAYVMGPPLDPDVFQVRDSANTYGIADSLNASFALADGSLFIDDDPGGPFDETEGVALSALPAHGTRAAFWQDHYTGPAMFEVEPGDPDPPQPDQQWRRIDGDWLGAAATLALQLDDRTNNTSLVLALATGPGDDVALFAGDAQIGNWSSWGKVSFPDGITGPQLLARTTFYKVGHHGSANATMKDGGLEGMTHPALKSFVPTDEVMAQKVGWGAIPAEGLLTRLAEKGTVVRSDKVDGVLFVDYELA